MTMSTAATRLHLKLIDQNLRLILAHVARQNGRPLLKKSSTDRLSDIARSARSGN